MLAPPWLMNGKRILLILSMWALGLLSSNSHGASSPALAPRYTHGIQLKLVHFQNSRWTPRKIDKNLQAVQEVYDQCGIKVEVVSKVSVQNVEKEISFDLEGYTEADEVQEPFGTLNYAKKYADNNIVTVFFFDSFDPEYSGIYATSMPSERIQQADQEPLRNTLWIGHQSEDFRRLSKEPVSYAGYNVLAHEMGHILLDSSHIDDHWIHNLMHGNIQGLNGRLTKTQCEQIKKSSLVKRLHSKVHDLGACPQIRSPLLRTLIFTKDTPPTPAECKITNATIENMASIEDAVSDLQPVVPTDFYFVAEQMEVQYMDRGSFESNLNISYDPFGSIPFTREQQNTLWAHEMGHAILNAQLKVDWPWYKQRLNIMTAWGNAVTQSTQLEKKLKSMQDPQEIKKIKKQIRDFEMTVTRQLNKLSHHPRNQELEILISPYHEFFADAVALLYFEDGQVLKKALSPPPGYELSSEEKEALEVRDYSYLRDPLTWDHTDAHALLTPTLALWWSRNKNLDPAKKTKPELLRELYIAIRGELLDRSRHPELLEMSVAEINQRLIKELRLDLK